MVAPQFVPAASKQELDTALSALVRISGTRDGVTVGGSGFVVGVDRDKATIVTASHVIEGVQQLRVAFAADLDLSFGVLRVLGMEAGNPNGLAALRVRGVLPAGVTILNFEVEGNDAEFVLLGFPQHERVPRRSSGKLSGRNGSLLLIEQGVGEGFSGGPVLQGGKVVGVITATDDQTTYAVNAVVAQDALKGWGWVPEPVCSTLMPTGPVLCIPREERTEAGIVFVRICPGTFIMGSAENDPIAEIDEKPAHQVTLSEFWLSKTEITNEQYRRFRSGHQGEAGLPVTNVSWADANAACGHFGGHLPTEAQWEYAARAGCQDIWSFGDDRRRLGGHAWYYVNAHNQAHHVGEKTPNVWGLHDMYGNVWEWVADRYGTYPSGAKIDPSGPVSTSPYRVLRGGGFQPAHIPRSADRAWAEPSAWGPHVGFRCAYVPGRSGHSPSRRQRSTPSASTVPLPSQ